MVDFELICLGSKSLSVRQGRRIGPHKVEQQSKRHSSFLYYLLPYIVEIRNERFGPFCAVLHVVQQPLDACISGVNRICLNLRFGASGVLPPEA